MHMYQSNIKGLEVNEHSAIVSVKPVVLPAPDRGEDLQVRVSAPLTGGELPIIIFSHGHGWSMNGYDPLVDFWVSHGFVVLQPTHLDSRMIGLSVDDPRTPRVWRFRVEDIKRILDNLDVLENALPSFQGHFDHSRIAVAGHSWGAQTVSTLLGARVLDANDVPGEDMSDSRIKAGVLLSLAGTGDELTPFAIEHLPFMKPSFEGMTTPSLIVAGDHDQSQLSDRGPDWFTDGYYLSPGSKDLLTLFGAEHMIGGISGYDVAETTDENPERVAAVQQLTWAYLRSALGIDDTSWSKARTALEQSSQPMGRMASK